MKINQLWLRIMGLSGILGGIILFVGDMLFYYDAVSTNYLLNMGNASDSRIIASSVSALIAAWFYTFGLGQVYVAFKPSKTIIRNVVLLCLASIMISYGVVHGAYVAIATTARLAVENNLDLEMSTNLAYKANQALRNLVYPIFAILSILFIYQVWIRKTLYPRWIIFFFPTLPFLFQGFLDSILTGSLRIIILGGYLNLIMVAFFTASTVAMWNKGDEKI
jgi:hypothetical protein